MSFSFSIPSKSKSNRLKKSSSSFSAADDAPIPNEDRPIKKLKNLPNLSSLSQSNLQFELDAGSNSEGTDKSIAYGLNLRAKNGDRYETDFELRKLREDLESLPEDTGMEDFEDVPVDGFGAALLSGYGWKEGRGIGRNATKDLKICEVTKKWGRGGLGFSNWIESDCKASENFWNEKKGDEKEKEGICIGKEVRIVSGREMGMKGKVVEVSRGGDVLVLRLSRNEEKVKVQIKDVAELGSVEEEKCLRKLKEFKIKEESLDKRTRDRNSSRMVTERVNWLRNHIRVRVISKELMGGRLFLKKGWWWMLWGRGCATYLWTRAGSWYKEWSRSY